MPGRDELALWAAGEAAQAAAGSLSGLADWTARGVEIDSRKLEAGDLFVAIEGEDRDGHDFVAKAFEQGAAAALVSRRPEGLPETAPLLTVPDTLEALGRMGAVRRAEVDAKICAVTGSAGKTGTKEMLRLCLEASGPTHASVRSFNNHLGVPLTLARMPRATRFGVFEIGMNHAGEITPLSRMVRPHVVIVTTVAPVHMEFFPNEEAIAEAKAEIFLGLEPGGVAILNRDNRHFDLLRVRAEAQGARIVGFGEGEGAEARLLSYDDDGSGSVVGADVLGTRLNYRIGASGKHVVMNSLGVLAAMTSLGADLSVAAEELGHVRAPEGRGRRHDVRFSDGTTLTLIDESYNANPASMAAALATLGKARVAAGGRRIAVLGDMLELGEGAPGFHAGLAEDIERAGAELVFCSGPLMTHLWEALPAPRRGGHAPDSKALASAVLEALRPGDTVMVKGSFGSAMRGIVDEVLARQGKDLHARAEPGTGTGEPKKSC